MAKKDLIFVLGIGRSGTSALTRVLSLCGGALPEGLFDAIQSEPKGIWEPRDALNLNEKFFRKNIATYFDASLRLQRETVFDQILRDEYIAEILSFLAKCPQEPILVVKEPRITALFEFWLEAARRSEYSVKVVIPLRHPREVLASFAAWGVPEELSSALWVKYSLLAERQSRAFPRAFVNYSNLLKSWRVQVARISKLLSIELKATEEATIDDFLTRDLYRRRISTPPIEVFGNCWISRVYEVLSTAAEDGAVHLGALDDIYQAYSERERAFRVLCSGYINLPPIRSRMVESSPRALVQASNGGE